MSDFPLINLNPNTASVDEIKAAEKTLKEARAEASCRTYGHAREQLAVFFIAEAGEGDNLTVTCENCGKTWTASG